MEGLMTYSQSFFGWLIQTTLIASVVICLILLIQKMLGGKLGPRWCHALWLVLLIRMILPWAPSSRLSLFNLIPSWDRHTQSQQLPGLAEQKEVSPPAETAENPEAIPEKEPQSEATIRKVVAPKPSMIANVEGKFKSRLVSFHQVLPMLWLVGAIVIGAYLLMSNFALWRIVKRDRPLVNQSILELFEECKTQMGIQSLVVVVPSDQVRSPGLFGFVRPRLLLPREMLDTATAEEMRYVFLHELAHLRRHDIYLGWLASLLQVLHWFNPLVWFAFFRMRADRELACDALVLTRTGQDKSQEYGGAIVKLVRRFSRSRPLPAMAGIIESKSQLKRRIAMITKFRNKSYRFSPLAVVLIVILASVSLPDAISMQTSETSTTESAPPISLRRIWAGSDVDTEGEISPDGRYISYVDWETGDLAVYEIATGKKQRLTNKGSWDESDEFAEFSRWSPDGKQIVYDWYNKDYFIELRIVGLDGSEPRILYRNKEVTWAQTYDWSPDGKQILACFSNKGKGLDQIVLVSVVDGSVRVLKTLDNYYPQNMVFSPDGSYIVYDFPQKESSPESDIFLLSVDGSREIPLVEHPADDRVLDWTPDGKNILFTSDRTGSPSVWSIAIADGMVQGIPKLVKPDIARKFISMGFTKDGSFYYGRGGGGISDIYITKLDPKTGKVLIPPKKTILRFEGHNAMPDYSPDGKYLAYVSHRGRKHFLCIRSLETGQEQEFPSKLMGMTGPRWSPDGNSILIVCMDYNSKRYGYYQVDPKAGIFTPVMLPSKDYRFNSHEWSRDGKSFFQGRSSVKDKCSQIMLREIKSGKEKEIYHTPSFERFRLACSPDGKWLAFINLRNNRALRIIPSSGGEPRELYRCEPKKEQFISVKWTADGKYILFVKREIEQKKLDLWRIPVEGGKPQKIDLGINTLGLSVHPDGQHIALCTRENQPAEVWVMENFLPITVVAKSEPMTTVRKIGGDWGTFASLSPDGRYICDVDWDTENLAVLELVTGKVRHLTGKSPDDACYPIDCAISPDSREVAYLWWDPNTKASSLHVVGLDGSGDRLLCEGKYPMPRAWSADAKKILAIVSENDVQQMVWISASDGSMQHIASFDAEGLGYPGKFDISPDGRFVVYDRLQAENTSQRDVFTFDLIENRESSVIKHPSDDKFLGWTPDGCYIFFASNRTGIWDAWLQQVTGGRPQGFPKLVKQDIGDVRPIGFTPNGSYYYAHERELQDVFTAKLDLETGAVLSEPMPVRQTGATACHDWSPDGLYLAYCERRPDKSQVVYIRTLATGRDRTLAENLPYIRWLRWSLDGRSILIDSAGRGDSQCVISKIDVQTGERTDLVRSETEVLIRPEMSPDGKTLYFARGDPKSITSRLIARDLESGREKELFRAESPARISGSALSPDGRQFILSIMPSRSGPEGPVLKILSSEGAPPKDIIQFKISEKLRAVGVTWMPDGRNVIFWKWHEHFKNLELWRISTEGGEPRRLWLRKALGQMRINPDGQHVAFYDRSTMRAVWVMENFLPEAIAVGK